MPTISRIKPDGTGDFTTLAAWEDFADGQASGDQWAECYAGGDLGAVTIAGWTATDFSASIYPKIYVPAGQRHNGVSPTSGAYILVNGTIGITDSTTPIIVDGLAFSCPNSFAAARAISISGTAVGPKELHNVLANTATISSTTGMIFSPSTNATSFVVRNTICNNGILSSQSGAVIPIQEYTHNVLGALRTTGSPASASTAQLTNCIFTETVVNSACLTNTGTTVFLLNNCASIDSTADNFTGANNLVDQTTAAMFRDYAGLDLRLKPNSPARGTGSLVSTVRTDILGRYRPQGRQVDIGAFEYPTPRHEPCRLAAGCR